VGVAELGSLGLRRGEGKLNGGRTGVSKAMSIKDVQTRLIKEKDGSYAIACSALGVYT